MLSHAPSTLSSTLLITREILAALLNPEAEPVQVLEGDGFTLPLTVATAFSSPLAGPNYTEAEAQGELTHYLAEHEAMLWQEARRRELVVRGLAHLRVDLPKRRAFILVARLGAPEPLAVAVSTHPTPHA